MRRLALLPSTASTGPRNVRPALRELTATTRSCGCSWVRSAYTHRLRGVAATHPSSSKGIARGQRRVQSCGTVAVEAQHTQVYGNKAGRRCERVGGRGTCRPVAATGGSLAAPSPEGADTSTQNGTFWARLRAVAFFAWSFLLALPLFAIMVVMMPFVFLLDRTRRTWQHYVNNKWACLSTWPFFKVQVTGRENLPPDDTPVVYVANHQSFMDIFSLFHLQRSFKFISKTSNFLIPIVGWSMFLTGHVMLDRMDRKSQIKCLQECQNCLKNGVSVLFFPEGTRSLDKRMQPFKKGAFSVAVKVGVPIIPISLIGTGDIMGSGKESQMHPGSITIHVHPAIDCKNKNADFVCSEAEKTIGRLLSVH